jgi:hypothetical protein
VISSLPPRVPDPAAISIPSAVSSASASRAVRSARIAAGIGWSAVITVLTDSRLGRAICGWPSRSAPSRVATLAISVPVGAAGRHRAGRAGVAWRARFRCGQAEHAQAQPGRVREKTLTPSIYCPRAGHGGGLAAIGVVWPVRPVTPPCRHDSGQPGFPGHSPASGPCAARPCAIAARAGALAGAILAGQRENVPPMYLGARLCRELSSGSAAPSWAASARARHIRGAAGNCRHPRKPGAGSVLIPRGQQAADLRKLPCSPGSSRSSRNQPNPAHGGPGRSRRWRATLFAAVRCARVPAAVQAGPCRVPLDPGKAARRLARAEMYPSRTHDGPGRAEPLTAQLKNAP